MEETFHEIYLNCVENKHIEWAKEKQSNRESYKKGMSQRTRDSENSTINIGSRKRLTLPSHIQL